VADGSFEDLAVGDDRARVYRVGAGPRAVALFHAWWGVNDDVLAYADRLAGSGFAVLAPDLVRGRRATTVEDAERIVTTNDEAHSDAVALAALDRLVTEGATRVGTVGFSFGAAWAIWSSAKRPAVAASVVYYGSVGGPSVAQGRAPVLGHFAEADPYEPDDNVAVFASALRDAGRVVTLHRYPGTSHWFAEPSRDAWRPEAAALAFERTVAFLGSCLDSPTS
jgi:carboxymethylenebutenolidase